MPEIANAPTTVNKVNRLGHLEIRSQDLMDNLNQDILPRVATGDPAAISTCLDRYGNLVWSLARRSLSDRQAAEDAVQEIFLKLWEVAGRFNPEIASETTFVAMIARRKLIDINRKKVVASTSDVEFDEFSARPSDVVVDLEIKDEAAKAKELLSQLPEDQQTVIKLNIFDGLSHARIAEATGLSLGTVKTHIRRGILKLRRALFPQVDLYGDDSFGSAATAPGEVG